MTSIKLIFRPSTQCEARGTLSFRIIHRRTTRQITTRHHIHGHEWDRQTGCIIAEAATAERKTYLQNIRQALRDDYTQLQRIVHRLEQTHEDYTAAQVRDLYLQRQSGESFFTFISEQIALCHELNRPRTAETYDAVKNSFARYLCGKDLAPTDLDTDLVNSYEHHLKRQGLHPNTTSFYLRNLRALYNRAVRKGLTSQNHPFTDVFTGMERTRKRAITLDAMKRIRQLNLTQHRRMEWARDLFLFSFYNRGMSFVDMAFLRKDNLRQGILTYRRKKTGQELRVKWEKYSQDILNRHPSPDHSPYLLPIITRPDTDERKQYLQACHSANYYLHLIGRQLQLPITLTTYVSRHAWASIARSRHVPLATISDALGHESEATTRIYLATLDHSAVDRANHSLLRDLCAPPEKWTGRTRTKK